MADSLKRFRKEFDRARDALRTADWKSHAFDPAKAYVCAIFAKIAYLRLPAFEMAPDDSVKLIPCLTYLQLLARQQFDEFATFTAGLDVGEIFTFDTGYAVVVGAVTQNVIIVAIRGTRPAYLSDWMIDLNTTSITAFPDDRSRVFHRGFYLESTKLLSPIITEVGRRRRNPDIPIYIVGHSLGGALSAIIHALSGSKFSAVRHFEPLDQPLLDTHSCYTFGMPRYGDGLTVTSLPIPYHAYHHKDLVPEVPPKWFGYADVPREYCLRKNLKLTAARRAAGTLMTTLSRANVVAGIRNHSVERYISELGKYV